MHKLWSWFDERWCKWEHNFCIWGLFKQRFYTKNCSQNDSQFIQILAIYLVTCKMPFMQTLSSKKGLKRSPNWVCFRSLFSPVLPTGQSRGQSEAKLQKVESWKLLFVTCSMRNLFQFHFGKFQGLKKINDILFKSLIFQRLFWRYRSISLLNNFPTFCHFRHFRKFVNSKSETAAVWKQNRAEQARALLNGDTNLR